MSGPRISVVLASFNGGRFIHQQVRTILDELGENDEVVISDDASTDDTCEVIGRFRDDRLRLLANHQRVGFIRNFERAIRASHGATIFFADQDDVWLTGKVAATMQAVQRAACIATDAKVVGETLETLYPSWFEYRRAKNFSALEIFLRPPIIGATMALRRSFLEDLLPLPDDVPHDVWVTFNAAMRGELIVLRQPLILYRRHANVASLTAIARRRSLFKKVAERTRLLTAFARRRYLRPSSNP